MLAYAIPSANNPVMQKKITVHFIALLVILAYLYPALLLGESSYVMIHDHLDSSLVNAKLLAESGMIFWPPDAKIGNIMNGTPVSTLGFGLNFTLFLIYFFGPFGGYVANHLVIRVIAYFGMYLLLTRHVITEKADRPAAIGASLAFAILPFYALFGLTIAGQPLLLYAFLNIRRSLGDWKNWLIIAATPFYSSFIGSGIFLVAVLGLLWIYDLIKQRKFNPFFVVAIILFTAFSILVDYRLVLTFLSPEYGFISHRAEFVMEPISWIESLQSALENFMQGQAHAASLHEKIILPSIALAAGVLLWRRARDWRLLFLFTLTALISLWYGLWWNIWPAIKGIWPTLPHFNMSRFHYFHPLLWYAMFGIALSTLWKHLPKVGKPLTIVLFGLQIGLLFSNSDHITQKQLIRPTYAGFFSPPLFKDIAAYIGKDKSSYRICSLGIHPSVALYNGFYTLDGYSANYPLKYKHQFRRLIEKELEKGDYLRKNFDGWGSRLYVVSSELKPMGSNAYLITKAKLADWASENYRPSLKNFDFNTSEFKSMGGQYLFSAIEIENAEQIGLHLEKTFDRDDSAWKIYLYAAR